MKKIHLLEAVLVLAVLLCLKPAYSGEKSGVIKIENGVNYIDLNGEGKKDIVIKAWFENFTAHGYYLYTFIINRPDYASGKNWLVVPIELEKKAFEDSFRTSQGADCVIRDIRLMKDGNNKVELIIAERPLEESFSESRKVTFYRYQLKEDREGLPGSPRFRFQLHDKWVSKNAYCDVNEAFEKELE